MLRINGFNFFQLGFYLKPLEDIKTGSKLKDEARSIYMARAWLEYFLAGIIVPITFSKHAGDELIQALKKMVPKLVQEVPEDKLNAVIVPSDIYAIANGLRDFQTILNTELGQLDTYFISRTGIYSTPELIERADEHFGPDIREKFSESTKLDIKQAGRCLAFQLPTAAGFHIMRATESVLKQYYKAHTNKPPRSSNWNAYITELKKTKANLKVLGILDQIRDLHRNPTIHPEVVLSDSEALVLFGIAQSAITAMIQDMPPPP